MNIFGKDEEVPVTEDTKVISNSLGIDLGTLNTVIAKPSGDKFDLYQIPSVVAVKKDDPSEVLAVGEEAKKMLGRTPEDILAVRPLKKGVIENVVQAQALLIKAMQIGINEGESVGRIVIGIPGDASEVEKNAAEEIGRKAGAQNILVISEGLAAAIGAGLPIAEPNGTMVVDIGAGSTASATSMESMTTFLGLLVSRDFPITSTLKFSSCSEQCTIPTSIFADSAS